MKRIAACLLSLLTLAADAADLQLLTDNHPPLHFQQGDHLVGYGVDVVRALAEQTGDRIDFTGMNPNGTMKLEAGQMIDAIGDVTITHEVRDGEEFTVIRGNTQGDNAADFELSLHGRHNLTINDFLGVS